MDSALKPLTTSRNKNMKIKSNFVEFFAVLLFICTTATNAAPVQLKVMVSNQAPMGGVALTPLWFGFHDGSFDSYNGGEASSPALEALAEDGNVTPIANDFNATLGGRQGVVFGDVPPLITPGKSGSSLITVDDGGSNQYFSYASMVLASSDYFVANGNPFALDVSSLLNGSVSAISFIIGLSGEVNDAGTEVNDFNTSAGNGLFAGLPVGQTAPGQGVDENGVVTTVINPYANFLNIPAGFDLAALDFNKYPNGIAQVTISAVPVPAVLPLAAGGFALLFGMGRLRKNKLGNHTH
jgi:hypothetical protein